ncbi:MAG: hypothetical protein ABJB47_09715 [Actinomycetota bacterium]
MAITTVVLAYLLVFPAFAALRLREPGLDRPFRIPGGRIAAAAAVVLATGWSALAAACLLWPGLGTAHPDAQLPAGFTSRGQFEVLVLAPLAVFIAAATAWHLTTRRRQAVTAQHLASPTSLQEQQC